MKILDPVLDKGTIIIPVAFLDEDNVAMIPVSITWTLRDEDGDIVNGRDAVVVTPASTINIVLSNADLVYEAPTSQRILRVDAIYNGAYGNGLTLPDYAKFTILAIPESA
jgi:hypothetical protein